MNGDQCNRNESNDENDREERFESNMWTYSVLLATIPLLYYGYYKAACCFVVIGMLYIGQSILVYKVQEGVPIIDKYKIKYNIYSAEDVIKELYELHDSNNNIYTKQQEPVNNSVCSSQIQNRQIVLVALTSLAKKYNKLKEQQKHCVQEKHSVDSKHHTKKDSAIDSNYTSRSNTYDDTLTALSMQYQDVVHSLFINPTSTYYKDDEVMGASFALLALIAKENVVRLQYNKIQVVAPDTTNNSMKSNTVLRMYDFDSILQCADAALIRAQEYSEENGDEDMDRIAAELQRKTCLLIGAISDNDGKNDNNITLSIQIGQCGGIKTILNSISWYRCHSEVVNWGLWSLFVLCYENNNNQMILIELNGISIILESMKRCCSDSIDVARHGTAILFDLLRDNNNVVSKETTATYIDKSKVRDVALSSGLHECLVQCMNTSITSSTRNMDVFVMGREILIGTNYNGIIPEPNMTLIPS